MSRYRFLSVSVLVFIVLSACSSDDEGGSADTFDRKAMLQNYADNLINPAYGELNAKSDGMATAIEAFVASPDLSTLTAARAAWEDAFTAWQYAAPYSFGPASTSVGTLSVLIATWPVDVNLVEQRIGAGDTSMDNLDRDTRGFLTVEYLLYGSAASDTEIIASFTGTDNQSRRAYLSAVVDDISSKVDAVDAGWDTFTPEFVENDGTSPGSSTSQLFNDFNLYYELVKNFKIGLPAGTRPGQVNTAPETTEAYYSGLSLSFATNSLEAVENIWYGRSMDGADGIGFEEYLASVPGGSELIADTQASWMTVMSAMDAIPDNQSLSSSIENNINTVTNAYNALQQHTRYFKSDMSSRLGISITYSSGDGD